MWFRDSGDRLSCGSAKHERLLVYAPSSTQLKLERVSQTCVVRIACLPQPSLSVSFTCINNLQSRRTTRAPASFVCRASGECEDLPVHTCPSASMCGSLTKILTQSGHIPPHRKLQRYRAASSHARCVRFEQAMTIIGNSVLFLHPESLFPL